MALGCLGGCDEQSTVDAGFDASADAALADAGVGDAGRDEDAGRDAGTPRDAGFDGGLQDGGLHDDGGLDGGLSDGGLSDGGDAGTDAGVDPDDPDGDGVLTDTEEACGTDPEDSSDFPAPGVLRGAGTDLDPYRICLPEHLALWAAASDVLTAHARLGDDLDMSAVTLSPSIGTAEAPFVGVFGGDGFVLDGLVVGTAEAPRTGIFGVVGDGGVLEGLVFTNTVSFFGSVLVDTNAGTVRRVSVSGTTNADNSVGLVVNRNAATGVIDGCSSEGVVTAMRSHVGGLVGRNAGLVTHSFSHATVSGDNRTGGLVGSGGGVVRESFATGDVSGARKWIGGLVGSAQDGALIENGFALGTVRAAAGEAGGVVGNIEGTAVLRLVYAQNRVEGSVASGGVLGADSSGGTATVAACFYDLGLTAVDAACVGRSAAELGMQATYSGFDFSGVWRMDASVRLTAVLAWE
ncbi:MAG: hypothetical protein AB8I08_21205 [Sandaracinaceae bacterium]